MLVAHLPQNHTSPQERINGEFIRPAISVTTQEDNKKDSKSTLTASGARDTVSISSEGRNLSVSSASEKEEAGETSSNTDESSKLTKQELQELTQLKHRDAEVRRHEQAHLAAAGGYATGGPSFSYTRGPDGKQYAIGGEVGIDVSEESTPEATITKMETIQRAALAPAQPSSTDRQIAAQAAVKEAKARQEVLQQNQEEILTEAGITAPTASGPDSAVKGANEIEITRPPVTSNSTLKYQLQTYQNIANAI